MKKHAKMRYFTNNFTILKSEDDQQKKWDRKGLTNYRTLTIYKNKTHTTLANPPDGAWPWLIKVCQLTW